MTARWIKRVVSLMLVCMMLLAVTAPALAAVSGTETLAHRGDYYYVNTSGRLNVRSGPGTGYRVKTSISRGTKVQFRYMENGWWYVRYSSSGKYGWVDRKYLTRSNVRYTGTYKTTARLKVRTRPSTAYSSRGTLSKGARIRVLEMSGDWSRINYYGYTGWVASKYLKKV